MKVAVTVWEDRVSPVFDSACTLLVAEIEGNRIVNEYYQRFNPEMPLQLVQMLTAQGVVVLICGAVSEGLANMVETAGLELIPFITGDIRKVFTTCLASKPVWSELKMPGCNRPACCNVRKRRGCGYRKVPGI